MMTLPHEPDPAVLGTNKPVKPLKASKAMMITTYRRQLFRPIVSAFSDWTSYPFLNLPTGPAAVVESILEIGNHGPSLEKQ